MQLPLALAAVALVAGCGGTPQRSGGKAAAAADGGAVFQSNCTGCHALGRLGSRRPVGDDLARYRFTTAQIASFVRVMPTPTRLSPAQIAAVAGYVHAAQQRHPAPSPQPPP